MKLKERFWKWVTPTEQQNSNEFVRVSPVESFSSILRMVFVGLVLVFVFISIFALVWWAQGNYTNEILRRLPWTFITALASAPALILLWHWRTVHKRAEIQIAAANVEATKESLQLARETQIPDRFARAIELLASDKAEMQLGGIYALEQISIDSPTFRWTVIETLAAFIRHNATLPEGYKANEAEEPPPPLPPEKKWLVQTALTVIGRRRRDDGEEKEAIDLSGSNLQGAVFKNAQFQRARFVGSFLQEADFSGAFLGAAVFARANLKSADFGNANLKKANFDKANLAFTLFVHTDLRTVFISRYLPGIEHAYFEECFFSATESLPMHLSNERYRPFRVDDNAEIPIDPDKRRELANRLRREQYPDAQDKPAPPEESSD